MTNDVYQVNWSIVSKDSVSRKVLVRICGEGVDVFLDRENEIRMFECMLRHGQGPLFLGRFANGRVEEFIKAREFHDLDLPGQAKVFLWEKLRNWLKEAHRLCSPEEVKEFQLDKLADEIKTLEAILSAEDQHIGFCHNDLQYGNIMMDEESKQVTIIDYEYASFNPVAYDLANHFFVSYSRQDQDEYVHLYLFLISSIMSSITTIAGQKLIDTEVQKMLLLLEKYALLSPIIFIGASGGSYQ
ncbi:hypothetical protein ZIOFF_042543 [Zingiber officinale]|uniref:Choline kinase n=1 Tax=Zingiber officinale TaxID=94328 RepID=A0A8J5FXM3_ZINOF|nr:hypothetical protein ZIOFF_042543 [Zingiber officinale]